MIGALAGDIIGSRFEWNAIKTIKFELFTTKGENSKCYQNYPKNYRFFFRISILILSNFVLISSIRLIV